MSKNAMFAVRLFVCLCVATSAGTRLYRSEKSSLIAEARGRRPLAFWHPKKYGVHKKEAASEAASEDAIVLEQTKVILEQTHTNSCTSTELFALTFMLRAAQKEEESEDEESPAEVPAPAPAPIEEEEDNDER
eukprot:1703337-Pyramimonas_sp.AAC.1